VATWSRTAVISVPWSKYDVGSRGALTSHSHPLKIGRVKGAGSVFTSAWCFLFCGRHIGFSRTDLNFDPSGFRPLRHGLGIDPSSGNVEIIMCNINLEMIVLLNSGSHLTNVPVYSVGVL